MTEDYFFVANKIADIHIDSYKKVNCNDCGTEVGITEASYKVYEKEYKEHKNMKVICFDCFVKKEDGDDIKLKRPSVEQIKEMRKAKPDLDETDIREAMENLKRLKDNGKRRIRIID